MVVVLLSPLASRDSWAVEPDPAGVEFYEKKVRPILAGRCYACHSAEAKKLRGGLLLDSEAGWLRGGDLGPAIKPGDPGESLIITAVKHDDELLKMPPKGKLGDDEVALLTRWVAMGAPSPLEKGGRPDVRRGGIDVAKGREFWAFRPPANVPVPEVRGPLWARNPIDRFVLAVLEAKGLTPAREADRRTLIRRATFDLTGLPPTVEEVRAFLYDRGPDAFERVVDRLLASPHYGERWGRHWLDVARYADSNGLDENVAFANAWRYRDYVIDAFNSDIPYDRFLVEQLAGDLLPAPGHAPLPLAERHAQLIATGFLALGPKVLAEPDEKKMEMDIVDEQIDTVGRAFLGLTIGCARCHDHKFDPIATEDYYGLAGIFQSTRTMENFKKVARWYENSLADATDLARKAAHEARVAAEKKAIEGFVAEANERVLEAVGDGFELPKVLETLYPDETKAELKRRRQALADLAKDAPEMPSALGASEGTVVDTPIHIRGSHLTLGAAVARRVPSVLAEEAASPPDFPGDRSGRLELARWMVDGDHPLTSRVMVNRIWRWHFGRGLVGTPDNFGALGDRPTHPLLLDWLARRFIGEGWSIKAMHRLIVLSSTYRMGSDGDERAGRLDPENTLYWRHDIQRLEAESIRDALLALGGALDRAMGGSLLTVKNRDYFFNHTSRDQTAYDTSRRSVYLPVVRNHLYDMFSLFDATDATVASGDRASTTVAPQALFMMNGDLVLDAAAHLATNALERGDIDDLGRIRLLYETIYSRPPTPAEAARGVASLARFDRSLGPGPGHERAAWQALCQVLLASNEFLYLR
jgi:hypothetical protein